MKRTSTLLLISAIAGCLQAQITITNATFPVAGDTLKTVVDVSDLPVQVFFTPPGGPQTWDFSFLSPDVLQSTVFRPASEGEVGSQFPDAELLVLDPSGTEMYYDVSTTSFDLAGLSGTDPIGGLLPIEMVMRISPTLPERTAPLDLFLVRQSSSNIFEALPVSALPPDVVAQFPVVPDSVRIRVVIYRLEVADGFGTLTIPGGTYEVLRDKFTTITQSGIDAKIPPLGWQDVTSILWQTPFRLDTAWAFTFYSSTEKEPIAIVNYHEYSLTGNTVVESVEFKNVEATNAVTHFSGLQPEVIVSPNPASDHAVVELKNFDQGTYDLNVFDAAGNFVLKKEMPSATTTIPLHNLSSGTYFIHVLDKKHTILAHGKLLKAAD